MDCYCCHCDAELVEDKEFNEMFALVPGFEKMLKCPTCGLSYHESNPMIRMTSKQYTERIMKTAEANWKKHRRHMGWWK